MVLVVQPKHRQNLQAPLFSNSMFNPMSRVETRLRGKEAEPAPIKPFTQRVRNDLDLIWTGLITSGRLYEGRTLWILIPSILYVLGGVWFASVFVRRQTGAHRASRNEEPRLYKIVEKLTIARGLPMPAVEVIESSGRNAYASGFHPQNSAIGASRGLLDNLNNAELEAVLAHEVAHIEGRDNRLMTIANLCTGAVSSVGRNFLQLAIENPIGSIFMVFFFAFLVPITKTVLFVALVSGSWCIAELLRKLISQKREFIADARAIEIMKSPAALISALQKVARNDEISGINTDVQAMMISNLSDIGAGTHPSIVDRVRAIEETTSVNWADIQAASRQRAPADMAHSAVANHHHSDNTSRTFGQRRRRGSPDEMPIGVSQIENEKLEDVYKLLIGLDQFAVSVAKGLAKFMAVAPWLLMPIAILAAIFSGITGLSVSASLVLVIGGAIVWCCKPKQLD